MVRLIFVLFSQYEAQWESCCLEGVANLKRKSRKRGSFASACFIFPSTSSHLTTSPSISYNSRMDGLISP